VSYEDVEPCPEVLQGVGVVSIDPVNEIKSRHIDGMTYLKVLYSLSEQLVLHQQELLCAVAIIDATRPPILKRLLTPLRLLACKAIHEPLQCGAPKIGVLIDAHRDLRRV
jgi:hypothetical protein